MHDSSVSSIALVDGRAAITFDAAYIHKCESVAATTGTGWTQVAILTMESCTVDGNIPHLPTELSGGSVKTASGEIDNLLVLPFSVDGEVRLQLEFFTGDNLSISGRRLKIELVGEPQFVEDVPFNAFEGSKDPQ